jgi:hypothetical protein
MRLLIGLTIIVLLNSCSWDERIEKYEQIINDSDKFKIYVRTDNDFKLIKKIIDKDDLVTLKTILKSDINLEIQEKFTADKRIEILQGDKVVGQLMINDSKERPFVNFVSDDLGFGFRLTYRIGMYLN